MYLYDKKDGKLVLYDLHPNLDKIVKYKNKFREYIIPSHIKASRKNPFFQKIVTEEKSGVLDIPIDKIDYNGKFSYHKIVRNDTRYSDYRDDNCFDSCPLVKLFKYNSQTSKIEIIKYLLIDGKSYYKKHGIDGKYYEFNDLILIPQELYLLELLNRGRIDLVCDYNIAEQLKLFDISMDSTEEISFNNLSALTQDSEQTILKKVEQSQKILKMIK